MHWQFTSFGLLFLGVTIIAVAVIIQAWQRSFHGDKYFILFMIAAAIWAFTGSLEWFVTYAHEKAFWSQVSYLGIVNVAPAWFCFTLSYCGLQRFITKRNVALLWIIPVVTLFLALTNAWHGWNWPSYSLVLDPRGNYMYYEHGPSFWVLTVYSYLLNIVSSIILLRQSGKLFRLYQTQSMILFVAVVIPWIGNILYNTRTVVILDLTPVAFTFTGALIWWNMRRFSLFDVIPVARESLFTKIKELFIVLDAQRQIVDMNESAQRHFSLTSVAIGTDSHKAFVSWPQLQAFISTQEITAELLFTGSSKGDRWFSATKTELTDPHNNPAGMIVICRDITSEKSTLFEREQLIAELKGSLANVKRLTGLLSICASCKKIKNEEGDWQQLEAYITRHTDATFSHGICPDCMAKIYPGVKQRAS